MPDWVIWVIVGAALLAGELFTLGILLGLVGLAALLAAVVALAGAGAALQIGAFILASLALLLVVRPVAKRHLRRMPAISRTGTAALLGQQALVLRTVDVNGGLVRIGGEIWTARAYDESQTIEPGARAEVMKIDGATALVYE